MKLLHAILPACALLLPGLVSAETFEGKVTMKITSPSMKEGSQDINFSIKEGLMRIDVNNAKGGQAAVVMDTKNQKMLILMVAQKMYMERPIPQPGQVPPGAQGSHDPSQYSLEATGTKETILGYECTKYVSKGADETAEIWVTDQLGTFSGLFHGGPGQRGQAPAAWEEALKGKGFFPMKVVANGKHGTTTLEVTAVDKESLPDSLFTAPEGWRDLSAMMGAMMPGGH